MKSNLNFFYGKLSGIACITATVAALLCYQGDGSIAQYSADQLCSHSKTYLKSGMQTNLTSASETDSAIDVNYYGLNLQVLTSPDMLRGRVVIQSSIVVDSLSEFFYNFSNTMTVDSVTESNLPVTYVHSMGKITFKSARPLLKGETASFKIHYHGVPDVTGFGSFVFDKINGRPSVWTLSEPYGAMDWFPCKNTPADKADSSDMFVTCSQNLTPVSNGILKEVTTNGDGTHTYHWKNSYPIAQYLISLAISDYTKFFFNHYYTATEYFPVENYIYPETFKGIDTLLLKTNVMLDIFSDLYGPYPFIREKYGHAEFGRQGGMEHQTISSMGVFNENIMAHELAQQWFGDKITCQNWENIWLNEGFATYSEALYNEFAYGRDAYDNFIRLRMSNAKLAEGSVYVQDIKSIQEIFSGNRSYAKGCIILHMLRGVMGDSLFFRALRNYAGDTSLAYGTAVTADFQSAAELAGGKDLDYFFDQWIYGEDYPKYNVSWNVTESGSSYIAGINISQSINTFPSYFTMPMEILISTISGDTLLKVFNNSAIASYSFTLNSKPVSFVIDPHNLILKDVSGQGITPVTFSLGQNFPNPFNPRTKVAYELARPSDVLFEIFDVAGREIYRIYKSGRRDGTYTEEFDMSGLPSGIYFYRLSAYSIGFSDLLFTDTKRMAVVK